MRVIATAGHVDHGKSTLVRALTGMEPDRWAEEQRRQLTIDLGYAWTTLPSGTTAAFVDVPGHRRFIGNMLAGVGPAPAVMLVVAADEGWRAQSTEHLVAIDALGIRTGLVVVTRCDLADPSATIDQVRRRLRASSLAEVPVVAASARTGWGLQALRAQLDTVLAGQPEPAPTERLRLWIDRVFSVTGAGTVITGTLTAGALRVGDDVEIGGLAGVVRGLHCLERPVTSVHGVARVAVNLRGIAADRLHRGQALHRPGEWYDSGLIDVRLVRPAADTPPARLTAHIGTASVPVDVRPLDTRPVTALRVRLDRGLPLAVGDRIIVRDPGGDTVLGAVILDVDPPALRRRGAARHRAAELGEAPASVDLARELRRRGVMSRQDVLRLGASWPVPPTEGVHVVGSVIVAPERWDRWAADLPDVVAAYARARPLCPWMPLEAARQGIGAPDLAVVRALAQVCDLTLSEGTIHDAQQRSDLGPAEAGLRELERRLTTDPFRAPEQGDLDELGLGRREIAAALRGGRLVRLGEVLMLPDAPERAARALHALPQPFTASAAREALETTRRVVIPLLEHLDELGRTRRIDSTHRVVSAATDCPDADPPA